MIEKLGKKAIFKEKRYPTWDLKKKNWHALKVEAKKKKKKDGESGRSEKALLDNLSLPSSNRDIEPGGERASKRPR